MFRQYRINRIKIKMAALKGQIDTIENISSIGGSIRFYYCDELVILQKNYHKLEAKLSILEE